MLLHRSTSTVLVPDCETKDTKKMSPVIHISFPENPGFAGFSPDQTGVGFPELEVDSLLLCPCVRVAGGGQEPCFLCLQM